LHAIAWRVLKAMPLHQREMLIRFYLQEQRPEGIQEAFGITPTQFRTIKSRAKARFAHLCRKTMERKPIRNEPHRCPASTTFPCQRQLFFPTGLIF
jgi:DNA-directed RNA polymerase specialized sigma24 family protein